MGHVLPWGGHCPLIPVKTKLCTGILQNSHLGSHWGTVLAFRHLPCCLSLVSFLQGLHYELILSTFFFISKEYQLTFTASSALPKPHITPKCSFSLPEGLSQHEWFYESGLYFSLREKLHIDWILEKKAGTFGCKFILCYVFKVNSYCKLADGKTMLLFIKNYSGLKILMEERCCRGDDCEE